MPCAPDRQPKFARRSPQFWQPSRAVIRLGGGHKLEPGGGRYSAAGNCASRPAATASDCTVVSYPVVCVTGGSPGLALLGLRAGSNNWKRAGGRLRLSGCCREANYCWTPPAQVHACGFPAYGSPLGCLTAKCWFGQGRRGVVRLGNRRSAVLSRQSQAKAAGLVAAAQDAVPMLQTVRICRIDRLSLLCLRGC